MTRPLPPIEIARQDPAVARAWEITCTVRRKRTRFRGLMLLVAMVVVCLFLFLGIWFSRWFLLIGLALAAPGYCLFVLLDQRHLWHWRSRMLNLWYREGLQIRQLGQVLEEAPELTVEARQSLLRTLTECDIESPGRSLTTDLDRREVAERLRAAVHRSERRMVTATVSFSLMMALGLMAVALFSGPLLVASGLAGGVWWFLRSRR